MGSSTPAPVRAYFDGLCYPVNPGGYACGGWVIEPHPHPGLAQGLVSDRFYIKGPGATNNVAEYHAALDALAALTALEYTGSVALYGDSQLVVNHVKGIYKCRKPELKPLLEELHRRAATFSSFAIHWIEREHNERADAQSRLAYQRAIEGEGEGKR